MSLLRYHLVDTSAGGLLVPNGVILPLVSASTLTCFIGYTYVWNLKFLDNVSISRESSSMSQLLFKFKLQIYTGNKRLLFA